MKKKIGVVAVATALCATVALASCGENASFKSVYKTQEAKSWTQAVELTGLKGYMPSEEVGKLFGFAKMNEDGTFSNKYLSKETGEVVLDTGAVELAEKSSGAYTILVKEVPDSTGDSFTCTVYDENGNSIATAVEESPTFVGANTNLFEFNEKLYKVSLDGEVTEVTAYSPLMSVNGLVAYGDYFYEEDESAGWYKIYDADLNATAFYRTGKVGTLTLKPTRLGNGDLITQYTVGLPDDAEDYDYFDETAWEKVDVRTEIIDADSGKVKEVDADYVFANSTITNGLNYSEFEEECDVDNIATIKPIVDGVLVNEKQRIALSNGGANDGRVDNFVEGQTSISMIYGTEYFVARVYGGKKLLLDKGGDVVGDITNVVDYEWTTKYLISSDGIYDYELNRVYAFDDNKSERASAKGEIVIVEQTVDSVSKSYQFNDGILTELTDFAAKYDFSDVERYGYYQVKDSETSYSYYNDNGALLVTTAFELSCGAGSENGVLMGGMNADSEYVFYFFK